MFLFALVLPAKMLTLNKGVIGGYIYDTTSSLQIFRTLDPQLAATAAPEIEYSRLRHQACEVTMIEMDEKKDGD